ncbi:hypothetical protein [Bacillus sp. AR18-7]|uniref:hypothetical protein n=1 Tax=Bacillus sp. AR18-7 TaxID=2217821 RepID=UPI0011CA215F|nr:hypothetical protein [Bacillus sp. AR18-7]TXR68278.1 hypothetical protein DN395_00095 [Bacillus sp. AR18-7]
MNILIYCVIGISILNFVMAIIFTGSKLVALRNNPKVKVQVIGGIGAVLMGAYIVNEVTKYYL